MMNGMPITMLSGSEETKTLYYANVDLERHSKPPGDWFPLVNDITIIPKGKLLGSIVEKRVVDGKNWYNFAVVNGWIMGAEKVFSTKVVAVPPPLTDQQKIDIVTGVIRTTSPTADVLIDTYEAGKKALSIGKYVVPVLVGSAVLVGVAYAYNSFKRVAP